MIGDPKHSELLFKDWDIQGYSKEVGTPCTKELEEQVHHGDALPADVASKVRRGIARVNYMAQDRPDLSAVAKTMSQYMSQPNEGVLKILKRCVRYLKRYPSAALHIPRGHPSKDQVLSVWTDSDWAGDVASRKSTSGGVIVYRGAVLAHWSKLHSPPIRQLGPPRASLS